MTRVARSPEDISTVKANILDAAKDILYREGFAQFSMRKLAAVLGMTAANIYNYFENKDEIYLGIQTAGFALLIQRYEAVEQAGGSTADVLARMVRAYIEFGLENRDYYEVMLGGNTPKYHDYIGTPLESTAFFEKQTALSVLQSATRIIANATGCPQEQAKNHAINTWVVLHGVVSLHNNRIFAEMDVNTQDIVARITADIFSPLVSKLTPGL